MALHAAALVADAVGLALLSRLLLAGGQAGARYRVRVEAGGSRAEVVVRVWRRGRRLRYELEAAEAPGPVAVLLAALLERGGGGWLYRWPPPGGERVSTVSLGGARLRLRSRYCSDGWLCHAEAVGPGLRAWIERLEG